MKVLTLSIKQKYFDEIVAGTKKQKFREVTPVNFKKYARYLYDGVEYDEPEKVPGWDDENAVIDVVPVKYDVLKLLTGEYKDKRPYIIIEVTGTEIQFEDDGEGNDVVYEHEGKEYARIPQGNVATRQKEKGKG
jgi:hypothetical protein